MIHIYHEIIGFSDGRVKNLGATNLAECQDLILIRIIYIGEFSVGSKVRGYIISGPSKSLYFVKIASHM